MTSLAWLIPAALALGGLGLAAFLWSLKSGQYDDLEGAAWRALQDREPGVPAAKTAPNVESRLAEDCKTPTGGHGYDKADG
ncbi:MAG: cbb3-type cytochrome oxidase assembly protein CcoS [Hyphomicrobiaceae bacterium]|nr:cbb3-type cytochrome oxidase assembly protein CcoS [Hyphomicrobiaceae bacterium]